LLDFFLTFSRFEFALKAAGFFKRPNPERQDARRPTDAKPDWDKFAVSLRSSFQPHATDALREAFEYIQNSPPQKQVIVNNSVDWKTPVMPEHESEVEFLLRMVRSVRNNLFHGGKHNIKKTERTELLLRHSLTILRARAKII
jgi:hypothetical protein